MTWQRRPTDYYFDRIKRDILEIIWNEPGLNHAEIAERLGKSRAAIEYHFGAMYKALAPWGVKDDLSLFVVLVKDGYFDQRKESDDLPTSNPAQPTPTNSRPRSPGVSSTSTEPER